ncbi:DUF3558 family protein [Actinoplanes sp. CA-142083]|uniref:DUF3558 family protein n=1 Tax=Actinoplanes sp. CA-142083 TaxID=3239903 RepID=UPI003D8F579C
MKGLCFAGLGLLVAVGGCGFSGGGGGEHAAAAATVRPSAVSGLGSVKDSGDIPDPCTLLSREDVLSLTGRAITQVDEDGGSAGDTTRFCQWQQDGGQLALFLSRTTKDDFETAVEGAEPVKDVGESAFQLAGHLYVLYGSVQIDVYSRGGSDEQNLTDAEEVVEAVMPRI